MAIPAAGMGRRMGGRRKPWLVLRGEPVLRHTLGPFLARRDVVAVRVALAPDEAAGPPGWLEALDDRIGVVAGGETRAHSVREAVRALPSDIEVIVVHDAARPLVTPAVVERCVAEATAAAEVAGVVVGWPAVDTLKEVDEGGRIVATPDRRRIWHAQTPQAFRGEVLRDAYERLEEVEEVTDDASLVAALGGTVRMVRGDPRNLKVTRPADLPVAELFLDDPEGSGSEADEADAGEGRP